MFTVTLHNPGRPDFTWTCPAVPTDIENHVARCLRSLDDAVCNANRHTMFATFTCALDEECGRDRDVWPVLGALTELLAAMRERPDAQVTVRDAEAA